MASEGLGWDRGGLLGLQKTEYVILGHWHPRGGPHPTIPNYVICSKEREFSDKNLSLGRNT